MQGVCMHAGGGGDAAQHRRRQPGGGGCRAPACMREEGVPPHSIVINQGRGGCRAPACMREEGVTLHCLHTIAIIRWRGEAGGLHACKLAHRGPRAYHFTGREVRVSMTPATSTGGERRSLTPQGRRRQSCCLVRHALSYMVPLSVVTDRSMYGYRP